jgi:hypothetical protein
MWQTYLLAAGPGGLSRLWFLFPLIVIISLVYSASRYELPDRISRRPCAARLALSRFVGLAARRSRVP